MYVSSHHTPLTHHSTVQSPRPGGMGGPVASIPHSTSSVMASIAANFASCKPDLTPYPHAHWGSCQLSRRKPFVLLLKLTLGPVLSTAIQINSSWQHSLMGFGMASALALHAPLPAVLRHSSWLLGTCPAHQPTALASSPATLWSCLRKHLANGVLQSTPPGLATPV